MYITSYSLQNTDRISYKCDDGEYSLRQGSTSEGRAFRLMSHLHLGLSLHLCQIPASPLSFSPFFITLGSPSPPIHLDISFSPDEPVSSALI